MPLVADMEATDFLRLQVLTARNVRGSRIVDFVYGGLNYQIEHHLFPTLPRNNLRRVTRLVKDYCAARGVLYTETTVVGSWREILGHLASVSRALAATE